MHALHGLARGPRPVEAQAENDEIALDAVQHGDARQRAPRFETEAGEELHARRVMAEDEAEHGIDVQRRRAVERLAQQRLAEALAARALVQINAYFDGARIRGTAVEVREAQPRDHVAAFLDDPQ